MFERSHETHLLDPGAMDTLDDLLLDLPGLLHGGHGCSLGSSISLLFTFGSKHRSVIKLIFAVALSMIITCDLLRCWLFAILWSLWGHYGSAISNALESFIWLGSSRQLSALLFCSVTQKMLTVQNTLSTTPALESQTKFGNFFESRV